MSTETKNKHHIHILLNYNYISSIPITSVLEIM